MRTSRGWRGLPHAVVLKRVVVVAVLPSGPSGPSDANLFTVGEAVLVLSDGCQSSCVRRPSLPSDADARPATARGGAGLPARPAGEVHRGQQ
jgi:hypothetical protein